MIADKGSPALRRRVSSPDHVFGDAGLADLDADLSNSPWIRGAPHSGLAMLISRISRRISTATVGRPERGRDFQRQYNLKPARCHRIHCVRSHDCQCIIHLRKQSADASQYQSVNRDETGALGTSSPQHIDLLAQHQNFCLKRNSRPQQVDHHSKDQSAQIQHRAAASPDSRSTARRLDLR